MNLFFNYIEINIELQKKKKINNTSISNNNVFSWRLLNNNKQ